MHMSAKLLWRSCSIDVLRHVFKQQRVENDRSHSTGMTRSLGLHAVADLGEDLGVQRNHHFARILRIDFVNLNYFHAYSSLL